MKIPAWSITALSLLAVGAPAQQPPRPDARIVPLRPLATDSEVVLEGTFFFAVSDTFDLRLLKELKAVGYAFAPKGSTMFGASPDGAVVQVHGVGPFHIHWRDSSTSLDAADAGTVFRFRKGDAVHGSRGPGKIRNGYASGTHIQYEVELAGGPAARNHPVEASP